MKKSTSTILALVIVLYMSLGCSQSTFNKKVIGNGSSTTKTLDVGAYDSIEVKGFMDVHLEKGTEGHITVNTDENIHEHIKVAVKDHTLILTTKENVTIKSKIGVHITVPFDSISKVALTGSGNIETKDTIKVNEFSTFVTGSGNIMLAVEASDVQAMITGSGNITISGSSSNAKVNLSGSGDFDGFDLASQNTSVAVSGSGNAEVVAQKNLVAIVSGSGDVIYKGNPDQKEIKTYGSGDISSYE